MLNNFSHAAAHNADRIKQVYLERFKVDLPNIAKFVGSDTTNAAVAVSKHIGDTTQVNCDMHTFNLILLYGVGLREHYKTNDGIQKVVTIGGEFVLTFQLDKDYNL